VGYVIEPLARIDDAAQPDIFVAVKIRIKISEL
jgi:hypothetical protein